MACPLSSNYSTKDCLTVAGVVKYYITPFANVLTAVLTSNVVTAITKTLPWKTYDQEPEKANWDYTLVTGGVGTSGYDWNANIDTQGLSTTDQDEFELLTKNKLVVIAEMNDGSFWMLGRSYGGRVSADAFASGTKMEDKIGNTITIKGKSKTKMVKVDPTIITGLLS